MHTVVCSLVFAFDIYEQTYIFLNKFKIVIVNMGQIHLKCKNNNRGHGEWYSLMLMEKKQESFNDDFNEIICGFELGWWEIDYSNTKQLEITCCRQLIMVTTTFSFLELRSQKLFSVSDMMKN